CGDGFRRRAKFFLPIFTSAFERLANCLHDRLAHPGRIAKTHFTFGRMHVHIDRARFEVDEEEGDWKLSLHQRGVITFAQRRVENGIFNRTPVNEKQLLVARLPAYPSATDESAYSDRR